VEPAEAEALREELALAADGDRRAVERAFTRLHPFVLAFCTRALRDPVAAEDATQEALVRLFAHVGAYDAGRAPAPWVLAFASNACRTARKRALRRRESAVVPDLVCYASPEAALLEGELRAAVQAMLAALPALDAETLTVAMGDDKPVGPTFRKRLQRALQRVRAVWRRP
jgi:RNA polymerase sigma-70 factor (ECF subfamily)